MKPKTDPAETFKFFFDQCNFVRFSLKSSQMSDLDPRSLRDMDRLIGLALEDVKKSVNDRWILLCHGGLPKGGRGGEKVFINGQNDIGFIIVLWDLVGFRSDPICSR